MLTLPAIVEKATPEQLASLREKLAGMDQLMAAGDIEALSPLTRAFHTEFTSICGQKRILRVIESQDEYIRRFSAMAIRQEARLDEAHQEHYRMVELVEEKDLPALQQLMLHHIECSKQNCLAALASQQKQLL